MPTVDYQPLAASHAPQALVEYITDARKAAQVLPRNTPANLDSAANLFRASLARAHPNAKPLAHIAISWPIHEEPTIEDAFAYAQEFLARLGVGDQPALLACHADAAHRHVHILLDRLGEDGRVLLSERLAERIIDVRDEIAREMGFQELGRNVLPTSNKRETAKAWNGRFTFTEYLKERLRHEKPASWADLDNVLAQYGVVRVPSKTGFRVEYHGSSVYRAKASEIGFGPKRRTSWGPQPPAVDLPKKHRPKDSYDAFLAREESLTPFAKTHPKRLEFERRRKAGENVGQLGRFLRSQNTEHDTMNQKPVPENPLPPDEAAALAEAEERRKKRTPKERPATTTQQQAASTPQQAQEVDAEPNVIRAAIDEQPPENRIGGPTDAAHTTPANGTQSQQHQTLQSLYKSFLLNHGASEARTDALIADAKLLIDLRRDINREGLALVQPTVDRRTFIDSLRKLGAFARDAHLTHTLSDLYSGQAHLGIDAFAHIAAAQLNTTPEKLAERLGSRGAVYGIDPSLASMAVLADMHVAQDNERGTWLYRVTGSAQTFEERDDRAFHFERQFNTQDTRTIDAALLAAAAIHGGRVEINGDGRFVEAAIARAAVLGIEVTNHRDRYLAHVTAVRNDQAKALERKVPMQDPAAISHEVVKGLAPHSRNLTTERNENSERHPYQVQSQLEWNGKTWILLRDAAADGTTARGAAYIFDVQPEATIALQSVGIGDILGIEGDGKQPQIVEHIADPARMQREDRENKERIEVMAREAQQRDTRVTR